MTQGSDFSDELGFEFHRADAVDLAVDVVIAVAQADVLDLGADLDHQGRALDLQVLDHGDGIAVLQNVTDRIFFTASSDATSASPLADHSWAHSGQTSWLPSS